MGAAAALPVMAGAQMFMAYQQAEAGKQAAGHQIEQLNTNARFADAEADEVLQQGQSGVRQLNRRRSEVRSEQRATVAAQGVDLDSGSVRAVMADTDAIAAEDERNFTNNTWRAAFGKRVEAHNNRRAADLTRRGAINNYTNTLLSGAINAGSTYAAGKAK